MALPRHGSCVLGQRPPNIALSGGTFPGDPLEPWALSEIQFVVAPAGTSTRILFEGTLASVGVTPQIGVQTGARAATVPLGRAGAGAALLPAPRAREARRRGAEVRSATPQITRMVGLVRRGVPLSAAASEFLLMAAAPTAAP